MKCVNHPERKVQPPSKVLCAMCLAKLSAKFEKIARDMGLKPVSPDEAKR